LTDTALRDSIPERNNTITAAGCEGTKDRVEIAVSPGFEDGHDEVPEGTVKIYVRELGETEAKGKCECLRLCFGLFYIRFGLWYQHSRRFISVWNQEKGQHLAIAVSPGFEDGHDEVPEGTVKIYVRELGETGIV
jgi:cell cycle arrest protein BUB3